MTRRRVPFVKLQSSRLPELEPDATSIRPKSAAILKTEPSARSVLKHVPFSRLQSLISGGKSRPRLRLVPLPDTANIAAKSATTLCTFHECPIKVCKQLPLLRLQ